MYEEKLRWSKELADRVKKEYDPYAVIVGLTTGGDSNVALKLATMFFDVSAAFTCDTTIGAVETMNNCEYVAKEVYGLKHIVKAPPYMGKEDKDTYFKIVKQHGFPGKTKTAHKWMYQWLKDHTVSKIISSIRQGKRNRNIIIISGARKNESARRMGTSKDITINGSNVWVNIANEWTDSEISAFSKDMGIDKLRSPISKFMGMSGECFCGCYAEKGELNELKICSPSTHEKITAIEKWIKDNTNMSWGWEQSPPKGYILEKHGQTNLFSPQMLMCSTCMNNTTFDEEQ